MPRSRQRKKKKPKQGFARQPVRVDFNENPFYSIEPQSFVTGIVSPAQHRKPVNPTDQQVWAEMMKLSNYSGGGEAFIVYPNYLMLLASISKKLYHEKNKGQTH